MHFYYLINLWLKKLRQEQLESNLELPEDCQSPPLLIVLTTQGLKTSWSSQSKASEAALTDFPLDLSETSSSLHAKREFRNSERKFTPLLSSGRDELGDDQMVLSSTVRTMLPSSLIIKVKRRVAPLLVQSLNRLLSCGLKSVPTQDQSFDVELFKHLQLEPIFDMT